MKLESCLGAYPLDRSGSWAPPDCWDADDISLEMSDHPNVCREDFSSDAGVYLPAAEVAFESAVWGVAEECGDARLESSVLGSGEASSVGVAHGC